MLENILINYFGLKKDYDKESWYTAYDKLISLIYDLGNLGVVSNANTIIDYLDKIDTEGEF